MSALEEREVKALVHKVANLLAAIYAFGEPALASGQGTREALEEILAVGAEVEEVLREVKKRLGRSGQAGGTEERP